MASFSQIVWIVGEAGSFVLELISRYRYLFVCLLTGIAMIAIAIIACRYKKLGRKQYLRLFTAGTVIAATLSLLVAYIKYEAQPGSALILATAGYLLAAAFSFVISLKSAVESENLREPRISISLLMVLLAALPIRFWELSKYAAVHHSEQNIPFNLAIGVLETGHSLFLTSTDLTPGKFLLFVPSDNFFADPLAVLTWLFGSSLITLKVLPMIFGILGVCLIFYIGCRWFSISVGFWAAFLLGISPYMIGLSREFTYPYGFIIPYTLLTFHFLLLSLEKPKFIYFFVASALSYFTQYIYFAALVLFPYVFGTWCLYFLLDKNWRKCAAPPMFFGALLALPVIIPYWYFMYRDDIYHYVGGLSRYMYNESRFHHLSNFWAQFGAALKDYWSGQFFIGKPIHFLAGIGLMQGYSNAQHLPVECVFFFLGLGACLASLKRSRTTQALFILLTLSIPPGFFSKYEERRFLVEQIPFYLIAGQGAVWTIRHLCPSDEKKLSGVNVFCFMAFYCLTIITSWQVFIDRAVAKSSDIACGDPCGFCTTEITNEVAETIKTHPDELAVIAWQDYNAAKGLVEYLVWDPTLRTNSWIKAHIFEDARRSLLLKSITPAADIRYVRFYFRTAYSPQIWDTASFKQELNLAQASGRKWQMTYPLENLREKKDQLFWLRVPSQDKSAAVDFVCKNLISCIKPQ